MKTVIDVLMGVMLVNGVIFSTFLSHYFWEDFCERRAKKQKQTNTNVNGL